LSLRQLKRILRQRSLRRRGRPSDVWDVLAAIEQELSRSGSSIGYRQMHQRLQIGYYLQVDRETVRLILKVLDPDGVETRSRRRLQRQKYRSKGPDFIWHIDGYDKLKPFGFCIHGAIDGYSRRILWLRVCLVPRPHYFARPKHLGSRGHARLPGRRHRNELTDRDWENAVQGLGKLQVCSSNNDPSIIASFYLKYIRLHEKTAIIVRGDCGTENVVVARIQRHLRENYNDSFTDLA